MASSPSIVEMDWEQGRPEARLGKHLFSPLSLHLFPSVAGTFLPHLSFDSFFFSLSFHFLDLLLNMCSSLSLSLSLGFRPCCLVSTVCTAGIPIY